MLGCNIAYHFTLGNLLRPNDTQLINDVFKDRYMAALLLGCLQPAIFEELFFRHLALRHFFNVMGVHSAVFISSLMFGLAHLGTPLSIPLLILTGLFLGYCRVLSGGLLLPITLHFFHNLAVMSLNGTL